MQIDLFDVCRRAAMSYSCCAPVSDFQHLLIPSMHMFPLRLSIARNNAIANVLFPEPVAPHTATR